MIQKIGIDCFGFGCCWPLYFTYTRYISGPILFGTRDWFHRRQFLHWRGVKEWFGDDSNVFKKIHSLCILFLLLLYHLHLRSSDIRPQRLETPKIWHWANICWIMNTQVKSFLFFPLAFLFSVHFSCSVMSDSLWPHELQHTRLPCPSLSPGVCSNSCPLSQRCHPTISSSAPSFSSCAQSFPESGSFPILRGDLHQLWDVLQDLLSLSFAMGYKLGPGHSRKSLFPSLPYS